MNGIISLNLSAWRGSLRVPFIFVGSIHVMCQQRALKIFTSAGSYCIAFICSNYSARNYINILYYSRRKNNCQKVLPTHSMITKRDFILRGSCFCEKYQ